MKPEKDDTTRFIAREFGFEGVVHEIYGEDVMISEHMFSEIGKIAVQLAREEKSFPAPELFTRLLGKLSERFYLHEQSEDIVLLVELGGQAHCILIPPGFWQWSEEARPEPAGMTC